MLSVWAGRMEDTASQILLPMVPHRVLVSSLCALASPALCVAFPSQRWLRRVLGRGRLPFGSGPALEVAGAAAALLDFVILLAHNDLYDVCVLKVWRETMKAAPRGFNLYLTALLAVWTAGCASTRDPNDKLSTLLRVHLEAQPHQMIPSRKVSVYRANPVLVSVESLYLLTEENVVSARVVDEMGTYAIEIQFNEWAIPLLDYNSSSWQGRRLAIQAQWGPKQETTRWLAAPKMDRKIIKGTVTFTPDATPEECYQIVTA